MKLSHFCLYSPTLFSKTTAETIMDANAIIRTFVESVRDKDFNKIEKYADRAKETMKTIADTLHSDITIDAEKLELEAYRHRVGAKLLEVILVDKGNADASSIVVNAFFAILSEDEYAEEGPHDIDL